MAPRDPIALGNLTLSARGSADLGDLLVGKLSPDPLAARLASLRDLVGHVVRVSPKEKVVFANARRLVAAMENV